MKWAVTIFSVLLGIAFLGAGGTKLAGMETHVEHFAGWGYPNWFMYVTGLFEVTAGILLLVPKTRLYGAGLLMAVMIGAAITHLRAGEMARLPVPIVILLLAVFLAWASRPSMSAAAS